MILQHTQWIGKKRFHFAEIDSTNKKAKEMTAEECPHGTLITADFQTAGTGRRGRIWSSEKNVGIYMSLVLRPQFHPEQAPMLTLVAALAVVKAVNRHIVSVNQKAGIKWPNDIVMNGKKICGILTEMILGQNGIDAVIVGVGINIANRNFTEDIVSTASSIYMETGLEIEKELLIEEIWGLFETYYEAVLEAEDLSTLKEEYEEFLVNKNQEVYVLDPKGAYKGTAKGITNTGELLVDTSTGIKIVVGGEVSVRGIYGYV